MVFPGIGRQAWVSGSLGGGTGRSTAWDTYDGTEDTAWQQWVDETSTALGSSYQVSYTENNSLRSGGTSGYLAITDGTQEYLGYFEADQADATNMQIKLNGPYNMDRPEIRYWTTHILMTSVEDYGSMVLFKDLGLTSSGKISGLFSFQPTNTRHSVIAEYWAMPGLAAQQYTDTLKAYSLIMMAQNPNLESGNTDMPVFFHKVTESIDSIYSTPSTGLTALERNTGTDGGNQYEAGYLLPTQTSRSWINHVNTAGTANGDNKSMPRMIYTGDSNNTRMRHPTFGNPPNNDTATRMVIMNWTPYHVTDGSTTGGNTQGVMWNGIILGHFWGLRHPSNTSDVFGVDDPQPSGSDGEYNDISIQNADRVQYISDANRSENDLGKDLIQCIRLDSGPFVGLYGATNGNKGGNLYINATARTAEDLQQWTFQTQPEYIVAEDISTAQTHASQAIAVSVVNGTDSTSTAFNPDVACLFKLANEYFAVIWRNGTTAYISVFSAQAQTSTPAAITREVDTVNLGTVPEGNLSGVNIGSGVALITCGNYYKFIKVPV
jgi:hypothetical protein